MEGKCPNPECQCNPCNCGPDCKCTKENPCCGGQCGAGKDMPFSSLGGVPMGHPPMMMKPPFGCPRPCAQINEPAPYFEAEAWSGADNDFAHIKLTDYKDKWVVLFFYPMDFTFVCPTEICAFSDAAENFAKINTVILGASTDNQFVHREWALRDRKQGGLAPLKIPILSDKSQCIAKAYGCLIRKGPDAGATYRATYIIDPNGLVRHISINDTPVGRSIDEVMRLVQAFQFTDEHGEVCPSNWKPGKKTMKPKAGDPDLKKYFEDELGKK